MPQSNQKLPGSKKKVISEEVFEDLLHRIISGEYPVGSNLPPERQLVEIYGVNRGAVREALQRLQQSGLVLIQHGGGSRIQDYRQTAGLDLLSYLIMKDEGVPNLEAIRGLVEMRTALAVDAARLCALRRSADTLDRLEQKREEIEALRQENKPVTQKALEFWLIIIDATGNIAYRLSYNSLTEVYSSFSNQLDLLLKDSINIRDYDRCIEAIRDKDTAKAMEVARKMIEHDGDAITSLVEKIVGKG